MLCSDDGDRLMTLAIGSGAANAAFVCGAAEVMARSFPPGAAPSWPGPQGAAPSLPCRGRITLWSSCRCQGRALPSLQATTFNAHGFACRAAVIGQATRG